MEVFTTCFRRCFSCDLRDSRLAIDRRWWAVLHQCSATVIPKIRDKVKRKNPPATLSSSFRVYCNRLWFFFKPCAVDSKWNYLAKFRIVVLCSVRSHTCWSGTCWVAWQERLSQDRVHCVIVGLINVTFTSYSFHHDVRYIGELPREVTP